jgi:hypothetical protein
MAEFADSRLSPREAAEMRGHLETCAECQLEFESLRRTLVALDGLPDGAPSHSLRAKVMGDIEAEKLGLPDEAVEGPAGRQDRAPARHAKRWWPVLLQGAGACALLFAGFALGEHSASQRQLADLRARVDTMGQLVEQSVLQKQATGVRLERVMTAATARKPDERVIDGLINTMAFDSSVNVRLNALNALFQHSDQEVVRAGVLACLSREPNPLVQVSMIDFLVASRAREASPEFRRLVGDDKADPDVRESARRAIDLL